MYGIVSGKEKMYRKSVDFWAEFPSPLKNTVREAFIGYARKVYEGKKIILTSYFPATMGGDMKSEDYLLNMEYEKVPENYLCMGFGESSDKRFYERFIKTGFFSYNKIVAWFPEVMVADTKRLEKSGICLVPESYFDLEKPCYNNEICIIGTPEIPDPLASLFIYRKNGEKSMRQFIENIAGFGAPVNAIRHIGKPSNKFGSVFIMPLHFANVCREIKHAKVIIPNEGIFAEPFVFFSKNINEEKSALIYEFLQSEEFRMALTEKDFFVANSTSDKMIHPLCKALFFPELEEIYPVLRNKFSRPQ